ncbi:roadblock/LC7 domain-containing protein [Deinococcus peraridilitoris]|uniref:Roadblock/LAMTOR2 domain-containing protein n=1 Tax=Deinococcus peraridilitoris (strain DSM 19664 / LMG 22246 / CIP 109416 / KR-200) TaxID=937777 RepID=L0A3V4_DEIPD|nr:roadblock/LC7 domain-containing protein [Deinococcus peraridilitoris]AFZ67877.1 hypothetical protein Deipe_2401 [Deinococcus peraridilitoris DSM 19664]
MQNPVYTLVSEALARVVSERAADHMLRAALRDARLSPEEVSAEEMQRVLAGPLENRLRAVMPVARAKLELSALASHVQQQYPKAPTLFPSAAPPAAATLAVSAAHQGVQLAPTASPVPVDAAPEDDIEFDLDDFELDDPGEGTRHTLPERFYDLSNVSGQDALLADLARFDGVLGVVLCDASGKVLRTRAQRGAEALGSVMVTTAGLLRHKPWRMLSADLGQQTVCVRPLGRHFVALLANNTTNFGRLIAELSVLKESA